MNYFLVATTFYSFYPSFETSFSEAFSASHSTIYVILGAAITFWFCTPSSFHIKHRSSIEILFLMVELDDFLGEFEPEFELLLPFEVYFEFIFYYFLEKLSLTFYI